MNDAPDSGTALPRFLRRYRDADFVLRQKIGFLYRFCFICMAAIAIVFSYSVYVQIARAPDAGIELPILMVEALALLPFAICLALLSRGRYAMAAHLLVTASFMFSWAVIWVDSGNGAISRLDSTVFLLGVLAMTPLVLPSGRYSIPAYAAANAIALAVFGATVLPGMGVSYSERVDFLADTGLAIAFVGIVSFNTFVVYRSSIDQAKRDSRERRSAEEALDQSTKRFRQLFHQSPVSIALVSREGRLLDVNRKITQTLGYTVEDIPDIGAWWRETVPDARERSLVRRKWMTKYKHARAEEADIEPDELEIRCKDGTVKTMIVSTGYLDDAVIVSLLDITERKAIEDERRALREQLFQAQKIDSIGKLAGGVAHDFNNMLGVILGYADMALGRVGGDAELADDLAQIVDAAKRSSILTRQLLAFARKQSISPRLVDLNKSISAMLSMLKRLIGENVALVWKPDPGVPPVFIDPVQVDQILTNLCVNARDAVGDSGEIVIETGAASFDADFCRGNPGFEPGNFAFVSVSDTGCGMDKPTMEQIFEPFFTTKRRGEGTGLGLPTVHGIVKQNDGFIYVYSNPGLGSNFKIYLPAASGLPDAFPPPSRTSRAGLALAGTETLLVVEDEPALLRQTCAMLESLGYRVLAAPDPEEALRLAREYRGDIDLVLTDVVMPGMNGRELAIEVRRRRKGLGVMYMSGYAADVVSRKGGLETGAAFIEKPFTRDELGAKLRELLET